MIMNHPFIVKLRYSFQTVNELVLVMDYCPGGDMEDLLVLKNRIEEEDAKLYIAEIILALEALHNNNIIFRDLKPGNVVIDSEGHALLTDFGISIQAYESEGLRNSYCGTPCYMAPEIILKKGHNKSIDWYHLGIFTY